MSEVKAPLIYKAMAQVLLEIGQLGISKDSKNTFQGYNFRGIDDIYNVMNERLASANIFVLPTVLEHDLEERATTGNKVAVRSTVKIKYTFYATDGSSVDSVVVGEGTDTSDKSTNKAMSASYKYLFLQAFCIPVQGNADADADHHELKPKVDSQRFEDAFNPNTPDDKKVRADLIARGVVVLKEKPEAEKTFFKERVKTLTDNVLLEAYIKNVEKKGGASV